MKRTEFIRQLRELLREIEDEEKEEALQYYEDYLEESGISEEAEVPESFGTPQRIAQTVKDGLSGKFEEDAAFTERGFQEFEEQKNQVDSFGGMIRSENQTYQSRRKENQWKKEKHIGIGMILMILAVGMIAGPFVITILAVLATLLFSGLILAAAGIVAAAVVGTALLVTGAMLCGVGFVKLVVAPFAGIVLIGGGLISMSVGLLGVLATVQIALKLLPKVWKKSIEMCKKVFQKKRRERSA